jgi:hypothetical protein
MSVAKKYKSIPPLSSLASEDVEGTALPVTDIPEYLMSEIGDKRGPLYEVTGEALRTDPEIRDGGHVVWLENAQTMNFTPLVIRNLVDLDDEEDDSEDEDDGDYDEEDDLLPRPLDGKRNRNSLGHEDDDSRSSTGGSWVRVLFTFAQGLFAGFSFATVYLASSTQTDEEFLNVYQPNAAEHFRFLYLLAAISLVGALDTLLRIISARRHERRKQHLLRQLQSLSGGARQNRRLRLTPSAFSAAFLASVAYSVAFFVTVLAAPFDVRVHVKNGFSGGDDSTGDDWTTAAQADGDFADLYDQWKILNILRLLTALVGWALSCAVILIDLLVVDENEFMISKMNMALGQWRQHAAMLEGDAEGIKTLDESSLQRLLGIQQLGVERVQEALDSMADI